MDPLDVMPRSMSKTKGAKNMDTPELYMRVNSPTVAENAIKNALWYGTPTGETIKRSVDHATYYGYAPADQYRAAILTHLHAALSGPDGLTRFIRRQLWRTPGIRSVRDYIRLELETDLTPAQIVDTVKRAAG